MSDLYFDLPVEDVEGFFWFDSVGYDTGDCPGPEITLAGPQPAPVQGPRVPRARRRASRRPQYDDFDEWTPDPPGNKVVPFHRPAWLYCKSLVKNNQAMEYFLLHPEILSDYYLWLDGFRDACDFGNMAEYCSNTNHDWIKWLKNHQLELTFRWSKQDHVLGPLD